MVKRGRITRDLFELAWPLALQSLAYTLLGMVDRLMVGQLAEAAISGVGLGGQLMTAATTVAAAVAAAAGILAAQARGAKQEEMLRHILGTAVPLGLGLGAVIGGGLAWQAPALVGWLANGEAGATAAAVIYVRRVAWAAPVMLLTFAVTGFLRALGETRSSLVSALVAMVTNTGLNCLLINGWWGFPAWGVAGAAIATAIAQVAGGGVALWYLLGGAPAGERFVWSDLVGWRAVVARQVLALAGPIALDALFWQAAALAYTRVIGLLGERALAAWFIFSGIRGLGYVPLGALGSAAAILAGAAIGAGRPRRATMVVRRAGGLAVMLAWLMDVGYLAAGLWYLPHFKVESEVAAQALLLIRGFTLILPVDALIVILSQALRAGGDGLMVSAITLGSFWLVGVPGAWLVGVQLGLGLCGCLLGVGLECLVKAAGFGLRLRSGQWARRLVAGTRPSLAPGAD
ncbi:MAG: Na+-driven multidrug efflux pump [Candidatus Ozemobacter sibiricus]|uniref:Multidrug-efflux transporter n=1 Tax=Candidatus Ozemobacter sibiricus TaxID=2268124 RepID=A0A367ZQL1_9BACT|nr:MAG: Na+-driven multidrug efflux pump [Candidatus Ozemobacter sibiricus]